MSEVMSTEIACVVDKSGSMHKVKDEAIEGFNRFLAEQRDLGGAAHLTLTLFNHEHELVHRAEPLDEVDEIDEDLYQPKGMTAMLDAVGTTIETLDERLQAEPAPDRSSRVLVMILTDGKENASTEYGDERVAEMIRDRDEHRGWEFLFWGANIDALAVADELNISSDNVTQFVATGDRVSAVFGEMSHATKSFRKTGDLENLS